MSTTIDDKNKVLLVDDRKENLYVLEKLLLPLDIKIYKATSGLDAIKLALEENISLILLDIQMPEMDGFEVKDYLNMESRLRGIPVIFVTAFYNDEKHMLKGYDLGIIDYLYKPINENLLLSKVKVLLDLQKQKNDNYGLRRRYELILDSAGDGIFGLDTDGNFNFLNHAASQLLGKSDTDLLGNSVATIIPDKYKNEWISSVTNRSSVKNNLIVVRDGEFLRGDGASLPIDYVITPLSDIDNNICGSVVVFQDVSDRKLKQKAEERLHHAEKMDAIGQLTGGVAHDFNNVLLIAQGNLELLASKLNHDSENIAHINEALRAIERGTDISRHLLTFSRKQTLNATAINVCEHLRSILDLLKPLLGERIVITCHHESDIWTIKADPVTFENAIMNLCINARDAMPSGGGLLISVKKVSIKEPKQVSGQIMVPGDYVSLSIKDQGAGMDHETLAHIFEPFFTTKGKGVGTGLGLSMVYGFINQVNGYITVDSQPGSGTEFTLFFPKSCDSIEKEAGVKINDKEQLRGDETILIAEDDSSILKIVSLYLKSLGYKILTAATGAEALEIIKSGKSIDLVFTDIIMPGNLSGKDLEIEAKKIKPGIKVLFTSGYEREASSADHSVSSVTTHHITKPYKLEDLAVLIRNILNNSESKQ